MATSAFRSTTRRDCQVGGSGSSAEPGGVPSTPRAKRDPSPSPSGRGFHRRSTSMSDFSARYLSDCSSTSDFRTSYNKSSRAGRHSVCPSDSESDMDSLYAHRRSRRWGAESEDERPRNPPVATSVMKSRRWGAESEDERSRNSPAASSVTKSRRWGAVSEDERPRNPPLATSVTKPERKGLRRTLSSQDFSQNISEMGQHVSVVDRKPEKYDPEDLVEEKTIRAVYAQMKSLRPDPPVGDVGMTDFLDAMRSEVRRAVTDIRMELEESMQKNGKVSSTIDAQDRSEPEGTDVIQAVAGIRKEYTTKLEESEKRVRELWSQIAVEERRCLELSKIVKELLPTQPPVSLQTSSAHSSSTRRRPLRRKNSTEKQLSLDEEALKYFEECVSISSYDCQADSDDSIQEKENSSRRRNGREIAKSPRSEKECKGDTQSKTSSIGSDGVVLPWLQWEAEGGSSGDKSPKQVERNHVLGKGSSGKSSPLQKLGGSSTQFHKSSNMKVSAAKKLTTRMSVELGQMSASTTLAVSTWSENRVCEATSDVSAVKQETCKSSSSIFTVDQDVVQTDCYYLDVDTLLFERIKFRCRVENGELLLCQGLFLM